MAAHQRWLARYGDPFSTFIGLNRTVITARGDAIKDIFGAPSGSFSALQQLRAVAGSHSVMLLDGDAHTAMRRLLNAALLDRRNERSPAIILDVARRGLAAWPRGRAVESLPLLSRIALEVILRTVCGVQAGERVEQFAAAFERLNRALTPVVVLAPGLRWDWGRWSPWGRFLRARRALTDLFGQEIAAARRDGADRTDALASLVSMRRADGAPALDDAALHDNLVALLFAGHLTTASSLAWAVHWIWATPGVLGRLRADLVPFARSGDPDAALRAPYLDAVCRETLRIRPVAPLIVRHLAAPLAVAGHAVPAGACVGVSIDLVHHDPALYPEPRRFDPERFMGRRYGATQFLPFGGGRRYCPGAALAMEEMRLVLAALVTTLELRLVSGREPRRQFVSGALLPKGGVPVVVEDGPATSCAPSPPA